MTVSTIEAEGNELGERITSLEQLDAVVYDIETYPEDESITDFVIANQLISVAVTYDERNGFKEWDEEELEEMVIHLKSFEKIIGFNIKSFDNIVVDHHVPGCLEQLQMKSLDLMTILESRLGHRLSLESICKPTLGISKKGAGKDAIEWAIEGEYDLLAEYCKQDVELTKKLFLHGLLNNEILYEYHGDVRKLQIDWLSPGRKFSPVEFTYRLFDSEKKQDLLLDPENKEFFNALELVRTTKKNLFITGKAGTGKTTFLKYVKSHVSKRTAVVAYTGVAAVNAGGQTIHSFFKISPNVPPFTPWDKRLRKNASADDTDRTTIYSHFRYTRERQEIFKSLELLIIDEISMVRADFLDVIDKVLRAFSGKASGLPFGGVQVVLIGDAFQLPPVEGDAWPILREFYDSPFFFSANVVRENLPLQIELKKIYRQNELEFISLLNRVRINQPSDEDLRLLNSKVRAIRNTDFDQNYIVLCSTNTQANIINSERLQALSEPLKTYQGVFTGIFPENSRPTLMSLELKEGAQVMFLKNGPSYYNGKIGTVRKLNDSAIVVSLQDSRGEISDVTVEKFTWQNIVYSFDRKKKEIEMEVVGTYTQYPVKLAWAITVHKSQGLSFEKVFVNISSFAPSGLVYVALSRCTSFNGLALSQPISRHAINTDHRVINFAQHVAPETLVTEVLTEGKADILYSNAYAAYNAGMFTEAYEAVLKAFKFRNDLETTAFKKVIIHILKLGRHAKKVLSIVESLRSDEKNQYEQLIEAKEQEKFAEVRKGAQALKDLSSKLEIELNSLRSDKMSLVSQRDTLTKERLALAKTNEQLKKKVEEVDKSLILLRNNVKNLDKELVVLRTKLESSEIENNRLSRITWIQKLLGKK
jgi:hypothetical protein